LTGLPYRAFEAGQFAPFIDSRCGQESPVHRICELFEINVSDLQKPPPSNKDESLYKAMQDLIARFDRLEEWIRS
jgi:hypothetical protein